MLIWFVQQQKIHEDIKQAFQLLDVDGRHALTTTPVRSSITSSYVPWRLTLLSVREWVSLIQRAEGDALCSGY